MKGEKNKKSFEKDLTNPLTYGIIRMYRRGTKLIQRKEIDTMMEKRLTKKDYFAKLLAIEAVAADVELVNFINHEVDLLSRKNSSGESKLTAKQKMNEQLKDSIIDCMEEGKKYTIAEMNSTFEELKNFTASKVNALVTQLKNEGKVVRVEEKRRAYFQKA